MGNASSNHEPSRPSVVTLLDQRTALAGHVLSGTVYVDVPRALPAGQYSLNLLITGSERAVEHYESASGVINSGSERDDSLQSDGAPGRHVISRRSCFWRVEFPLTSFEEGVQDGSFAYPFHLTLPPGLPASVSCPVVAAHSTGACGVAYALSSTLHREGGEAREDIKHQTGFLVQSYLPRDTAMPLCPDPVMSSALGWCCVRRGRMAAGVAGDTAVVAAGGTMRLFLAVLNGSPARVKAVEITLSEEVTSLSGQLPLGAWRVLFRRRFRDVRLGAQAAPQSDVATGTDEDLYMGIKSLLDGRGSPLEVPIPTDACSSFVGRLLTVTHQLTIVIKTTGFSDNLTITHPVTIVNHCGDIDDVDVDSIEVVVPSGYDGVDSGGAVEAVQLEHQTVEAIAVPGDWDPTAYPVAVVSFDSHSRLPINIVVDRTESRTDNPTDNPMDKPEESCPGPLANTPMAGTVDELVDAMLSALNPAAVCQEWMTVHESIASLEGELPRVFAAIRQPVQLCPLAVMLGKGLGRVSCAALAAAAHAVPRDHRRGVVAGLIRHAEVSDPDNREILKGELSPYHYLCITSLFEEQQLDNIGQGIRP